MKGKDYPIKKNDCKRYYFLRLLSSITKAKNPSISLTEYNNNFKFCKILIHINMQFCRFPLYDDHGFIGLHKEE